MIDLNYTPRKKKRGPSVIEIAAVILDVAIWLSLMIITMH